MSTIALVGNPNSGKTTIFNYLAGLQQQVGNFAGVTVERKSSTISLGNHKVKLVDLPGTYSLYPLSEDEQVVNKVLLNPADPDHPDLIIYVADVTNLERHLLLFTQVSDLGFPVLLVCNRVDLIKTGNEAERKSLANLPAVEIVFTSRDDKDSLLSLEDHISTLLDRNSKNKLNTKDAFYTLSASEKELIESVPGSNLKTFTDYAKLQIVHHHSTLKHLKSAVRKDIDNQKQLRGFNSLKHQVAETMSRFDQLAPILQQWKMANKSTTKGFDLDSILTHRIAGPIIFFALLFLIFQAIFNWASYPMDAIEAIFQWISTSLYAILPDHWIRNLITNGVIPGITGVVIFIPQIFILFFFIGWLEESGYMSRAVYMFDRLMQQIGLNGRSIVSLISAGACAVPAIMAARNIQNKREKLITILVTPFVACSARTPVYILLIVFAVPSISVWGVFNLQGLAFFGLYLLGLLGVICLSLLLKQILKESTKSYLMIEMPAYQMPQLGNTLRYSYDKVKTFVWEAGKIIFAVSIVLWFLCSYGSKKSMEEADAQIQALEQRTFQSQDQIDQITQRIELEHSYAGRLGKVIEPIVRPLGYDWQIGIALITSFAAREVFVGTMATIYNSGNTDEPKKLRDLLVRNDPPSRITQPAVALSLLVFYVFAMQCMSTMAIVRKETGSWKWPILQFIIMTATAYLAAFATYQVFN